MNKKISKGHIERIYKKLQDLSGYHDVDCIIHPSFKHANGKPMRAEYLAGSIDLGLKQIHEIGWDAKETDGVLAHELGHHDRRDLCGLPKIRPFASVLISTAGIGGAQMVGLMDPHIPLLTLGGLISGTSTALTLAIGAIENMSRNYSSEYKADKYAINLTKHDGFIKALEKMRASYKRTRTIDSIGTKLFRLYTHPPIDKRIHRMKKQLAAMQASNLQTVLPASVPQGGVQGRTAALG